MIFANPVLAAIPGAATATARPAPAVAEATGAALQGDARRALQRLHRPGPALEGADARFRDCMLERFGSEVPPAAVLRTADPWIAQLVAAYRAYWHRALRAPQRRAAAEALLRDELWRLAKEEGAEARAPDFDAIEPRVARRVEAAGLHALQGRTGPLRDLMLWHRQEPRDHDVVLPEGVQRVRVTLLDGFEVPGWGDYATCSRRGTGGWATTEGLFAVVSRYPDLQGEEFQVSFLAHEAQHAADLSRHPGLPSWRLEYRAKLAELALVERTLPRLLAKFAEDQSDDPAQGHGYANRRVLTNLRAALQGLDPSRIRAAAAAELRRDSQRLARRAGTALPRLTPPPSPAAQRRSGPASTPR